MFHNVLELAKIAASARLSPFASPRAANRGIPLPEAMEQSRHKSVQQASSYYNSATRRSERHQASLTCRLMRVSKLSEAAFTSASCQIFIVLGINSARSSRTASGRFARSV